MFCSCCSGRKSPDNIQINQEKRPKNAVKTDQVAENYFSNPPSNNANSIQSKRLSQRSNKSEDSSEIALQVEGSSLEEGELYKTGATNSTYELDIEMSEEGSFQQTTNIVEPESNQIQESELAFNVIEMNSPQEVRVSNRGSTSSSSSDEAESVQSIQNRQMAKQNLQMAQLQNPRKIQESKTFEIMDREVSLKEILSTPLIEALKKEWMTQNHKKKFINKYLAPALLSLDFEAYMFYEGLHTILFENHVRVGLCEDHWIALKEIISLLRQWDSDPKSQYAKALQFCKKYNLVTRNTGKLNLGGVLFAEFRENLMDPAKLKGTLLNSFAHLSKCMRNDVFFQFNSNVRNLKFKWIS